MNHHLYDHSHIKTIEHASLFKTAELELTSREPTIVGISFYTFAYNAMQKRVDPVYEVRLPDGRWIGTYFASAFKTMCL